MVSSVVALLQYYLANDQKLKKYVPLIRDSLVYPVIYDVDRTLLSLPPIINGSATAVSDSTSSRWPNRVLGQVPVPTCCTQQQRQANWSNVNLVKYIPVNTHKTC